MKNCLIMGSGRSGTSMLGGVLHEAGYFMGEALYPARNSNPKGFFENAEINGINESILAKYDRGPGRLARMLWGKVAAARMEHGQRWLMSLPAARSVRCLDPAVHRRIKAAVRRTPFAYKDPRFSYTLPVWKRHLPDSTAFICIFRAPDITVQSILKECSSAAYLQNLPITEEKAYEIWGNVYAHILKNHDNSPERFMFVHYHQVIARSAIPRLSRFLGVSLKSDFVEEWLNRTRPTASPAPPSIRETYETLCSLAGYRDE